MSSGIASIVGLSAYAIALLPFAWMAWRPAGAGRLGWVMGVLIVGLALVQTGIFQRGSLATTQVDRLIQAETPTGRCDEIIDVLSDHGVLLEPLGPQGLVVRKAAWQQIPAPIADAVIECARLAVGTDAEIRVIQR